MIKRRTRPRMGVRESPWYRSQGYRAWVAGFECAIAGKNGHVCVAKSVAAHTRTGTDGCKGEKPSDWWCIPLCDNLMGSGAHPEQHNIGEAAFERKYGIDMKAIAQQLWKSPLNSHRRKYERTHPAPVAAAE